MRKALYITIPRYSEEDVLRETARRLSTKMDSASKEISDGNRIVFIGDGSKDKAQDTIKELHQSNPVYNGINLSQNRGHQNALLAGFMTVKNYCDMATSMNADPQDDIGAIDEMVDKFYRGYDIVYGVRSKGNTNTLFRQFTTEGFYGVVSVLGADTAYSHADYRLMSERALEGLTKFKEVNLFLREMIPMIEYSSATVYYMRNERFADENKYPLKKMLAFTFEGIMSLSTKPTRIIIMLGNIILGVSVLMLIWSMAGFYRGTTMPGWASIMVLMQGIGGILILSVGVVGEYIGKIYPETKERLRYIVESFINQEGTVDEKIISY